MAGARTSFLTKVHTSFLAGTRGSFLTRVHGSVLVVVIMTLLGVFFGGTDLWAGDFTPALFTVREGKQVYFSQGNLQCTLTATDTTWSFAENQYDMLGIKNVSGGTEDYDDAKGYAKVGTALADKIDLFGWSGDNETAKWGISTSTEASDYSGDFVDWGSNTIGIYAPNTFRTLTYDEWEYLLNTRTNASEKKGIARIKLNDTEYVNGLILLPDSWTCPTGVTFKSGYATYGGVGAYATYQTFTLAQWQQLEKAGAVFLPASGERGEFRMYDVQGYGRYRSATMFDSPHAYILYFYSLTAKIISSQSYIAQAVRLVQDYALHSITTSTSEHGSVAAGKATALAGETITLTVTPDTYYTLKALTVLQGTTEIKTTAVEGASNQYTFIMPPGEVNITAKFEKLASAFTPVPFSIAAGRQVYFSQGNLQCAGVTSGSYNWSFAEYQTDMLGTDNVSGGTEQYGGATNGYSKNGTALADTIDMFGWSGNTGTAKWGISSSPYNSDYSGDFVDWGKNTIGTSAPNTYRTLTLAEWTYLLELRTDAVKKKGVARIYLTDDGSRYVNGLILLPDDCPTDITFNKGYASTYSVDAYATQNTYTLAQWRQLEAVGAVFLPAEGRREGTKLFYVQLDAPYWSSTPSDSAKAYYSYFTSNENSTNPNSRYRGHAVRLVQDLRYAITITPSEHGYVAVYQTEYAAGSKVTLTVIPYTGYELDELTVVEDGGKKVTVTEYTFTMPANAVTVTATFKKKTFTITATAKNGTVEGGGTYDYGTQVTLTAKPDKGFEFSQWSDGTKANPYELVVTKDLTMEAEFVQETPTEIDTTQSDAEESVRKVLIDGELYILRGGNVYTGTGMKVR